MTYTPVPPVSGVYLITNTSTGKFYVGSSKNCRSRWYAHTQLLRAGKLQKAWNKYGEDAFSCSLLEETAEYKKSEQHFIDTLKPDYSIALSVTSAMLGRQHSEETRNKMRLSAIGRTISAETRMAISRASTGRKHSPESIERMRVAHLGQSPSEANRAATVRRNLLGLYEDSRAKISAALKGRTMSKETIAKRTMTNTGSKRTPEARARMSAAQKARFSKEKTNG